MTRILSLKALFSAVTISLSAQMLVSCAEDSSQSGLNAEANAALVGANAGKQGLFSINLPIPENTSEAISSVDLLKGIDPSMELSLSEIVEKCVGNEDPPTISEPPPSDFCPVDAESTRSTDGEFYWLQINEDMWAYQPSGIYPLNVTEMARVVNTKDHKVLSARYKNSAGDILANLCSFDNVTECPIGDTLVKLGENQLIENPGKCQQCACTPAGVLCTQTECPVRCEQDGKQYQPGQTWKNGSCQQCSCKEDGSVSCEAITTGSCGVCVENTGWNKGEYKVGDTWNRDKCYTCECKDSGQISCQKSNKLICIHH